MKRVAIVGLSPDSHNNAPWDNPNWSVWGFPWDAYAVRCDLLFEMHDPEVFLKPEAGRGEQKYWDKLKELPCPVLMQKRHEDIPTSLEYPLAEVQNLVGDYFGSSPAYALAYAILWNVRTIGIWGVNLSDSIYDHQRPNMEYLIGFARGRGQKVYINGETSLLRHKTEDRLGRLAVTYPTRYGYLE